MSLSLTNFTYHVLLLSGGLPWCVCIDACAKASALSTPKKARHRTDAGKTTHESGPSSERHDDAETPTAVSKARTAG